MKILSLDIETNTSHDRIWCCSIYGGVEADTFTCSAPVLQQCIDSADIIVGHNIIAFDAYLLEKLWGITIPFEKLRDTLILSRLYSPENKPHSLEA